MMTKINRCKVHSFTIVFFYHYLDYHDGVVFQTVFLNLAPIYCNCFCVYTITKQFTVVYYSYRQLRFAIRVKALLHLSQESTRKLAASIFIQSQCSKVYFNEMHTLAASLRVGFAISGKEP